MRQEFENTFIPISKKKALLAIAGCVIFILISLWLLIGEPESNRYSPEFIKIVAILGFIFFGGGMLVLIIKLFDKNSGLLLDKTGVWIRKKGKERLLFAWHDVTEIEEVKVHSTRLLLIFVQNPEECLEKETGKIRKNLMQANLNLYGTPFCLSSNAYQCKFDDLQSMIEKTLKSL